MTENRIQPTLPKMLSAYTEQIGLGSPISRENQTTIKDHFTEIGLEWAVPGIYPLIDRQHDKVASKLATGLARHTLKIHEELGVNSAAYEGVIRKTYLELNKRLKTDLFLNSPEFTEAIYSRIMPTLLAINGVGDKRKSNGINNSYHEYVDLAETIASAETTGHLIIFGPICANYAIPEASHDAETYATPLINPESFDQDQINAAFWSYQNISSILQEFGIQTTIINPQITAHPYNISALVPASFWQYVENGTLPEMFRTLDDHADILPGLISTAIGVDQQTISHSGHSLAESDPITNNPSTIESALTYADQFLDFYNLLTSSDQQLDHWMSIDVRQLEKIIYSVLENHEITQAIFEELNWSPEQTKSFISMVEALAIPKGCLEETKHFYSRYASYQPPDIDLIGLTDELQVIGYSADLSEELATWSVKMANIQIGARAILNETLYFSLGEKLAQLNTKDSTAIMLPLGIDDPVWEREAINRGYQTYRQSLTDGITIPGSLHAPIIYPKEELRQPFCKV